MLFRSQHQHQHQHQHQPRSHGVRRADPVSKHGYTDGVRTRMLEAMRPSGDKSRTLDVATRNVEAGSVLIAVPPPVRRGEQR